MNDIRTISLFAEENKLRFARITNQDVDLDSNNLKILKKLTLKHQELYPNIDQWFDKKVMQGLITSERIAYIGFNNDIPIVSAVLKLGAKSKFCHVHIDETSQNMNLGEVIFSMMALDAQRKADNIYFTLPESLWEDKKGFFKSFGFNDAIVSGKQYRNDNQELYCSASLKTVLDCVIEKLPKIITSVSESSRNKLFDGILMSIKPQYMNRIMKNEKRVEIRRKFNKKWKNRQVILYSSAPEQVLSGYATIDHVIEDTPEKIWIQFGHSIGGTREEFDSYTIGCEKVFAIILREVRNNINKVPLWQVTQWLGEELAPPQSYVSLEKNTRWKKAIVISELLGNSFNLETQVFK